jgi:hypothetical protein
MLLGDMGHLSWVSRMAMPCREMALSITRHLPRCHPRAPFGT